MPANFSGMQFVNFSKSGFRMLCVKTTRLCDGNLIIIMYASRPDFCRPYHPTIEMRAYHRLALALFVLVCTFFSWVDAYRCKGGDFCCGSHQYDNTNNPKHRCGYGEGDCDYDSDCVDGLVCGNANCHNGWGIRTRFNMKKDPTTMRGMKNTQLKTDPKASFVQYRIGVQPSIVTH